jgi:hypothetical protein
MSENKPTRRDMIESELKKTKAELTIAKHKEAKLRSQIKGMTEKERRHRSIVWGNYGIFAGLVKCGKCSSSMNQRVANSKAKTRILTCAKYNKYGVSHCSQHRLEPDTLYQIVLEQIRSCAALALADETKVIEELRKSYQCDSEEENRRIKAELSEGKRNTTVEIHFHFMKQGSQLTVKS